MAGVAWREVRWRGVVEQICRGKPVPRGAEMRRDHGPCAEIDSTSARSARMAAFQPLGRSVICRCAAFQPLALLALQGRLPASLPPGQARAALMAVMARTLGHPDSLIRAAGCGSG